MKAIKWLDKNFELAVMAVMLAVMSILSFANVIMRYCFHSALSWSDELCCYCLALSAFYALPCAIRMGSQIRVDTFTNMMPKGVQRILNLITGVIMLAFLGLVFKGSLGIALNAAKINQASPALRIPLAQIYGLMAFGIGLAIFRYIQALYLDLVKKGEQ